MWRTRTFTQTLSSQLPSAWAHCASSCKSVLIRSSRRGNCSLQAKSRREFRRPELGAITQAKRPRSAAWSLKWDARKPSTRATPISVRWRESATGMKSLRWLSTSKTSREFARGKPLSTARSLRSTSSQSVRSQSAHRLAWPCSLRWTVTWNHWSETYTRRLSKSRQQLHPLLLQAPQQPNNKNPLRWLSDSIN